MNKIQRQDEIKRLIGDNKIGTQEEIKHHLENQGITVTQATLSRDLREIGLIKIRNADGKLYYSLTELGRDDFSKQISTFVHKVSQVQFMLVLGTNLGEADVLANIIDQEGRRDILGTVAGADTLLVICQSEEVAETLYRDISAQL
ncbi:arginine repressor [Streptococcus pluranimalium]|uniref:Arginine repressor n=1 Tax=Streptococcus agalactiae LMG 14747 TaxID=1154860 RepID=V6Z015_STRAG|nr:arginine repressor [Streptococcus hyovaginalis]ESV54103.1 arginine repressor [Streptococcus agalactiae LMG 14747]MDY5974460.1 arginine repressor [Streptococcus hyovaginalis]